MAITIQIPTGRRITVAADSVLVGRDRSCQVALPDESSLQPIHARIRKVANRWLIEAQGDWQIQVGTGLPGRMSWLKPGDVIRLTESGPEIIFDEGRVVGQTRPASAPIPQAQKQTATKPRPVVAVPGVVVAQQAPLLPPQVEATEPLPPPPLPTQAPLPLPASAAARSVSGLPGDNRTKPPQGPEQPAGLLPPLIGMMVVVGFAFLMGLYGFLPVFTDDLREPTRNGVLLALTLLQNALAMFGLAQTLTANRRYGFTVLGSLLALTSWGWLLFTTAPIAVTLLGTLAGLSVGFWGVAVLKNPQVRAQFKDGWVPAERWWQRTSAPAISGMVGGGALAVMLTLGFLLWLTTGEKRQGGYSTPGQREYRDPRDVRDPRESGGPREVRPSREIKNRTGGATDEPDGKPGQTEHPTGKEEYDKGYETGQRVGKGYVRAFNEAPNPAKAGLRMQYLKTLRQFEKEYQDCLKDLGPDNPGTQRAHGIAEGYRKALQDGGILR